MIRFAPHFKFSRLRRRPPVTPTRPPNRTPGQSEPIQAILHSKELKQPVQAKLRLGRSDDPAEREAERFAARFSVQSRAKPTRRARLQSPPVSAHQAPQHTSRPSLTPAVIRQLHNLRGGHPLPGDQRRYFEAHLGHDLGAVRLHSDPKASLLAESLQARAFTHGRHIVFNRGELGSDTRGRRLLAHELAHVVQQARHGGEPAIQRQTQNACSARYPENCPTYELWLNAFRHVPSFIPRDGALAVGQGRTRSAATRQSSFSVLGRASDVASRAANAPPAQRPPTPVGARMGDRFIDHPTDQWVRNNLPANLLATAYQLPADCADVFVILRHVYLSAHHRVERYGRWEIGSLEGAARQRHMGKLIRSVYSGNADRIVNPYSDGQGRAIRDYQRLQHLLHPGDQLVWDHFANGFNRSRSGGHTQTISEIIRNNSGGITGIDTLQGNQPLGLRHVPGIVTELNRERAQRNQRPLSRRNVRSLEQRGGPIRSAPGRRIEVSRLEGRELGDITLARRRGSRRAAQQVWGWHDADNTILVAAGPPRSATRPRMRRQGGQRIRRISDWFASLGSASLAALHGVFEAALHETRALLDGGQAVSNQDAMELGRRAGGRLWDLARKAVKKLANFGGRHGNLRRGDLGDRKHFEPLHRLRAMVRALGGIQPATYHGNPQAAQHVRSAFILIDNEFNYAARGGQNIGFSRKMRRGGQLVKVLVTGFDPFNTTDISKPPRAGEWNPSGAAAMAMDGSTLNLGGRDRAAIEGAVLPVSYAQFRQNLVERMAFQVSQDADAVLTVSVDPNLPANAPVRIEQFAVGVHRLTALQPHRLFPVEPAHPGPGIRAIPGGGPPMRETRADVTGIAQDTQGKARGHIPAVQQPTIGRKITLRFQSRQAASQALQALGLSQAHTGSVVTISDEAALRTIMRGASHLSGLSSQSANFSFSVGTTAYNATLLSGPGGRFLSNEIAYRMQRELRKQSSAARSFHVHTPEGNLIPQGASKHATQQALTGARTTLLTLIATLRRIVLALARRVLARRQQQGGGPTP